jgi:hypothetical protein
MFDKWFQAYIQMVPIQLYAEENYPLLSWLDYVDFTYIQLEPTYWT